MKDTCLEQEQFPEVLSQEELTALFQKNPNQNPKVLEKIFVHNLRLVASRIATRFPYGFDYEELFSVGCQGLLKAVRSFDLSRNVKFITYSVRCIDNEILYYIRKNTQNVSLVSLEQNNYIDGDGNEQHLIDVIPEARSLDSFQDVERQEKRKCLMEAIASLSPREQKVILLHYGFINDTCATQKEISKQLHLSQGHVSRIAKTARKKLETILRNYDDMFEIEENEETSKATKVLKKI